MQGKEAARLALSILMLGVPALETSCGSPPEPIPALPTPTTTIRPLPTSVVIESTPTVDLVEFVTVDNTFSDSNEALIVGEALINETGDLDLILDRIDRNLENTGALRATAFPISPRSFRHKIEGDGWDAVLTPRIVFRAPKSIILRDYPEKTSGNACLLGGEEIVPTANSPIQVEVLPFILAVSYDTQTEYFFVMVEVEGNDPAAWVLYINLKDIFNGGLDFSLDSPEVIRQIKGLLPYIDNGDVGLTVAHRGRSWDDVCGQHH